MSNIYVHVFRKHFFWIVTKIVSLQTLLKQSPCCSIRPSLVTLLHVMPSCVWPKKTRAQITWERPIGKLVAKHHSAGLIQSEAFRGHITSGTPLQFICMVCMCVTWNDVTVNLICFVFRFVSQDNLFVFELQQNTWYSSLIRVRNTFDYFDIRTNQRRFGCRNTVLLNYCYLDFFLYSDFLCVSVITGIIFVIILVRLFWALKWNF